MSRRFQVIDVFSDQPFRGNPLAVVHDADSLSTGQMQQFARWMNLSETAFLLRPTRPDADYRVRIFTLARELPFAGHPTIGSCHAWLGAGGEPRVPDVIMQECGIGIVAVRRNGGMLSFAAPPLVRSGSVDPELLQQLTAVLDLAPEQVVTAEWVDNGPGWVGVLLKDAETVLAVDPDFSKYSGSHPREIGLIGPYPAGSGCAYEVRALFSDESGSMREDPVTGSLNAGLAQWLLGTGRAKAPYVASQGTRLGRRGRVYVDCDRDSRVWIGGPAVGYVQGDVDI